MLRTAPTTTAITPSAKPATALIMVATGRPASAEATIPAPSILPPVSPTATAAPPVPTRRRPMTPVPPPNATAKHRKSRLGALRPPSAATSVIMPPPPSSPIMLAALSPVRTTPTLPRARPATSVTPSWRIARTSRRGPAPMGSSSPVAPMPLRMRRLSRSLMPRSTAATAAPAPPVSASAAITPSRPRLGGPPASAAATVTSPAAALHTTRLRVSTP